jgi:hypothetical protein
MEEQLTPLLIDTLKNSLSMQHCNTVLDKYFDMFDKKKYIGKNFESIYKDMSDAYNFDLQSIRYGYNNTDEKKTFQDLILAVINESDLKKKIKLIALIIYLDDNRLLYDYLYQINYFNDFVESIKDFFVGTIGDSEIKINNIDQLSDYHHEKEWYKNYKYGIESLNFQQIYSFVEGFERGRGFNFDIYVDFLIFIAYKYFFDDLVNIATTKKDMFEILYLTHILTIEETLTLASQTESTLLKFEAIRKAIHFQKNKNLLENEQKLLQIIIVQLAKDKDIWQQFLDYHLEYPLRSVQLFRPLGEVINELDNNSRDMLIQSVKIDKYLSNDSKEALNCCFINIQNNDIKKYCLEALFNKWDEFIDVSDDYFGSIVLTNVVDLVIVYVRDFLDEKIFIKKVERILDTLKEIDNRWFMNISEQSNYFYKLMSKLFVYSFAFEKYQLIDTKLQVKNIVKCNSVLKKEQVYQAKTTLQLFDEYIFK